MEQLYVRYTRKRRDGWRHTQMLTRDGYTRLHNGWRDFTFLFIFHFQISTRHEQNDQLIQTGSILKKTIFDQTEI